jgi:hypothetical protein
MNRRHACRQPGDPRKPRHRHSGTCYAELRAWRRGGLHPHHRRLTRLNPDRVLGRPALVAVPTPVILGVGSLVRRWH